MINIDEISKKVPKSDSAYVARDGLLHCAKCGEPLEAVLDVPLIGRKKVRCVCSCMEAERALQEGREEQAKRERVREECFGGSKMMKCTFDGSSENENLNIAKNYVENFEAFKRQGTGLLLFGKCGTGKSHMAACIANALIDKGERALMTNFATMINILQSAFEGRQEYINSLNRYGLLVIDDLGAERKSDYMRENVFNIIDARYLSGLPMIITTNLTAEELKRPTEISSARIYERLLEKCHPIEITGRNIRRQHLQTEYAETQKILKGAQL